MSGSNVLLELTSQASYGTKPCVIEIAEIKIRLDYNRDNWAKMRMDPDKIGEEAENARLKNWGSFFFNHCKKQQKREL